MKHDFEYRFCGPLSAPEELGGRPPQYRRTNLRSLPET